MPAETPGSKIGIETTEEEGDGVEETAAAAVAPALAPAVATGEDIVGGNPDSSGRR